ADLARGIRKSERGGRGAAALADGRAAGRNQIGSEENAGGCGTGPAREFVSGAVFVERERVRIYRGHDWAGSRWTLDSSWRARCAGADGVFESLREERDRTRRDTEFAGHGADG